MSMASGAIGSAIAMGTGPEAVSSLTYSVIMRAPVTHEALDEKATLASTGTTGHRRLAMQLLAWAEHPHEQDEFSIADLLVRAGEEFALAQDHASALEAYTRAFESEVPTSPDARGFMIQAPVIWTGPTAGSSAAPRSRNKH